MSIRDVGQQVNSSGFFPSISATGRYVAFASVGNLPPEDTRHGADVFVRNRVAGSDPAR